MIKTAKKILIVEDEASITSPLRMKLEKDGFKVLTAENGKRGLALALKENPDLILLDIVMPVMDGLTMLQKLREDKVGKSIKIIILTNLAYLGAQHDASEYKVAGYLIKSEWKISDLIKKIKAVIK